MTRIHERIETSLPIERTFDLVADFANAERWDPGVVRSTRIDRGPLAVGASYDLEVRTGGRVAPMTYRVTALQPPHRVVLVGSGSGVDATDEIVFSRTADGTAIDYTADIRLGGLLRLAQPFLGGTFDRIGRDAAAGMRTALAELADAHEAGPKAGPA
jgi:carbon monoxide dehydrogenase subunit G